MSLISTIADCYMEYKSIREKGPMTSDIEPLCLLCVYLSLSLFLLRIYMLYIYEDQDGSVIG